MSDSLTAWTVTCQAPLSMGFSRQEYWSGLPFPSPGDLPDPGIEPESPALGADALPSASFTDRWVSGKESSCQCRRCKRHRFGPWIRKIPWRRKWQPTPVFLPRRFHGQWSLAGYSPRGCKEKRQHNTHTHTHTHIHTHTNRYIVSGIKNLAIRLQS